MAMAREYYNPETGRLEVDRRRYRCAECRGSMMKLDWAPWLYDEIWLKVARKQSMLCVDCLGIQMQRVFGRDLCADDLVPPRSEAEWEEQSRKANEWVRTRALARAEAMLTKR
jgi:hypothetical protein